MTVWGVSRETRTARLMSPRGDPPVPSQRSDDTASIQYDEVPRLHDVRSVKEKLCHVLWIGGPPDCGKTSVATRLAERYDVRVYHFDRHEMSHFARADPIHHPALLKAHPDRMSAEFRWLGSLPEIMAKETIACWSERAAMAIEDIQTMSSSRTIIAGGPGFFPEFLASIISDRSQAIWLLPSDEFKSASVTRRDKPASRWETSDPERAQRNLIKRDLLMREHIHRTAEARNLAWYTVDGSKSFEQVLADIERHFGAWLPDCRQR